MTDEDSNDNAPEGPPPSDSSELDDELNLNGFNIGQQFADDLATLSESFQTIQQAQVASIADAFQPLREIQQTQAAELAKSLQSAQALQQAQIAKLIEPLQTFQEIQRTQLTPLAEHLQELSRMQAGLVLSDFPDEVFTTAVAASAVSVQARTSPSTPATTLTTSSPEPSIETEPDPTPPGVNREPTRSLYLEAAVTIGVYLSYRIEGLDQSQRKAAAALFTGCIVFGATPHLPVSEIPLIAGSAATTFTRIALMLRSGKEQE